MSRYRLSPIDLSKTQSYSLQERPSKVTVRDFASSYKANSSFNSWLESLPNILAAKDLRNIAQAIVNAQQKNCGVIIGLGGHVVKCGLAPVLIDLMKRGFVTGLAMNGSAAIHDFEIALVGFTSEDVDASLGKGDFGMAEETGQFINQAALLAVEENIGFGEALGKKLARLNPTNANVSLICAAYQEKIPLTIHLAIGTDIVHMHKTADGATLGAATHHDFRLFCSLVTELSGGGVYLNLGSAVLMPEVFLKAVTVVRNLGLPLEDFTTANLDFIQHYRPLTNVVKRPVVGVGKGYAITGHHELLIPLLAAAIVEMSNVN
ncbi:MAG: hypothetical protein FD167_2894 [bacterium]|nr:MAG: hypothetical protein FD167_2894 [bacterium]